MIKLNDRVALASPGEDCDAEIVIRMVPDQGVAYAPWNPATVAVIDRMLELPLADTTVLDFGAGSGILGLVADKLGAVVSMLEYIPEIADRAQANVDANDAIIPVVKVDLDKHYDFIFANIGDGAALLPLIDRCNYLIGTASTKRKRISGGQGTRPVYETVAADVQKRIEAAGRSASVIPFDDEWAVVEG